MDVEDEDEVDEHLLLLRRPRRPITEGDGTDDDIAFNLSLNFTSRNTLFLRILLSSKSILFTFRTGLNV